MSSPYDLLSAYNEEYVAVKQATSQGYILCEWGGVADLSYPTSKLRRGRVQGQGQICPILLASSGCCIYRIEKIDENKDE